MLILSYTSAPLCTEIFVVDITQKLWFLLCSNGPEAFKNDFAFAMKDFEAGGSLFQHYLCPMGILAILENGLASNRGTAA